MIDDFSKLMNAFRSQLLIGLICLFVSSFSDARRLSNWVELAGQRYEVELALTDVTRARGLMFRHSMAKHHGMLFIHDHQEPLAYWMKNCKFPLDILFFDEHRHLVGLQRHVPPCPDGDTCPAYPSQSPARYVLEVNAGEADRLHLHTGMTLQFSPTIPAPHL